MQNLVSLNLTAEKLAALDAKITALEQEFDFLVDLTPEKRRSLVKMGDKSEAFCRQCVTVLGQNTDSLPPSFNLAEVQRDVASIDHVRPRLNRLTQLREKIADTELALGSDIMVSCLEGYGMLKYTGKGAGLDELRQGMSARFAKSTKKTPPPAP